MKQSGKKTLKKPTSQSGVSVLFVLYALLLLGVAGLAGWLYWQGMSLSKENDTVITAEILSPTDTPETVKETPPSSAEEKKAPSQKAKPEETLPASTEEKSSEKTNSEVTENVQDQKTAEKPVKVTDKAPDEPSLKEKENGSKEEEEEQKETPASRNEDNPEKQITENPVPVEAAEPKEKEVDSPPSEQTLSTGGAKEEPLKASEKESKALANEESPAKEVVKETGKKETAEKPAATEKPVPTEKPEEEEQTPTFTLNRQESKPDAPLPAVPDPALTRKSDYGLLPVIGPDGRLPWRVYRKPFEDPLDRPRIAIVISEMGFSKTATRSAIQNLPGAVTLSFNPYSRDLQSWVEQARAAGHEVLLQLPMEPFGYPQNDPGDHSLLTSLTDKDNLKRLDWMLGRFTGYSGVTNQMGSKFTASPDDIRPVLDVIKSRGLLFLDGRTSSKSVAGPLSAEIGIPVAINNRFLDHKANRATIDARLQDLERIARYTGTAVGIGYPYPVTLERISNWSKTLARKGFVLVPVSAAVNRQEIQ
ncbi:MAG: divergent polysaccharide deacetylase family protein [Sneathiellales bacterium]|nr:divergent polysaccharide deacetylase family protein [Sneathiellales bacterium]